jgi:hypothetical protein
MSKYMLNKIRTEPEIFGSKADPSVRSRDQGFPQSFDFEGQYRRGWGLKWVLSCDFFLVRALTVEYNPRKHNLEESLFGLKSTLLPTVHYNQIL